MDETHADESVDAEQDYWSVLDTVSEGYFEASHAGVVTFANRALNCVIGFSERQGLTGRPLEQVATAESTGAFTEHLRRLYNSGRPVPPFECFL